MEKIFDEDTINELNGIYGIENCKWEILDYIRYLKIRKENNFVNYHGDEIKILRIWNYGEIDTKLQNDIIKMAFGSRYCVNSYLDFV